jgi:hypothetical protein
MKIPSRFDVKIVTNRDGLLKDAWLITLDGKPFCYCVTEQCASRALYLLIYAERLGGFDEPNGCPNDAP